MDPRVLHRDRHQPFPVRRCARPEDVFLLLGIRVQTLGLITDSPVSFMHARVAAQRRARASSPGPHPDLERIHHQLAQALGLPPAAGDQLRQLELEIEAELLRPHPKARDRLAAARAASGGPLAFISDMYLPGEFLAEQLQLHDLWRDGDSLYVSCEHAASKGGGDLFRVVAAANPAASLTRWNHLGDHPVADGAAPARLGIQTRLVNDARLSAREHAVSRGCPGMLGSLLAGSMRLARMDCGLDPDGDGAGAIACDVMGPLLYGYLDWSMRQAVELGLNRLYFISRDGQPLLGIARAIKAVKGYPLSLHYLHGSRLTFMPPQTISDSQFFHRQIVPSMAVHHSLSQAMLVIGADAQWAARHLPATLAKLDPKRNLNQEQRDLLLESLLSHSNRERVRELIECRAKRARRYLAAMGLAADQGVGIVDTGWRGTIQRYLEDLLGGHGIPAFYVGFSEPPDNRPRGARFGYTNAHHPLPLRREPSCKVLIELFTPADHPQVIGYRENGRGGLDPVFNDTLGVAENAVAIQQALNAFAARMAEAESSHPLDCGELAECAIGNFLDFHKRPSAREARTIGGLAHANQIVDADQQPIIREMSTRQVVSCLGNHKSRPPNWWLQGQSRLGHGLLLHSFLLLKRLRWKWMRIETSPPSAEV